MSSENHIDDDGMTHLASALMGSSTLTNLDVRGVCLLYAQI
jgi:hypothetical protein